MCVDAAEVTAGSKGLSGKLRADILSPSLWASRKCLIWCHRFSFVFSRRGLQKNNNKWTIQKTIKLWKTVSVKVKNNTFYFTLGKKNVILPFNFLYIMSTVNVWSLLWWRTTKVFTCLKTIFRAKSKLNVLQNCSLTKVTGGYHRRRWTLCSSSPWSLTSFTFLPLPVLDLSACGFGDFLISGGIWSGAMETWRDTHWGKAVFSKLNQKWLWHKQC